MSARRGRNNVKRAIVNEAVDAVKSATNQATKVVTNNYNPLFHYLQTMFPNYDNAVLHAVLDQEGNSIERAIEVLLAFADVPSGEKQQQQQQATVVDPEDDWEIKFFDNPFLPPASEPVQIPTSDVGAAVSGFNSGREHVSLYEYQKKRKSKKSQRARRRQQAYQLKLQQQQQQQAAQQKKPKWVPLQDFNVGGYVNPFAALEQLEQRQQLEEQMQQEQKEELLGQGEYDECQILLSEDEIEESWQQFEEATAEEEQQPLLDHTSLAENVDWNTIDDALAALQPLAPACEHAPLSTSSDNDDFVVIERLQQQAQPVATEVAPAADLPVPALTATELEQHVVVKIHYSASDIHRLSMARSALTFARLYEYAAAYLGGKCQLLPGGEVSPRAFALTYVDDEGDTIHLCSEEELAETLRLHDEVFWTDGKQPILRLRVKSIEVASHDGHILVSIV